jgi:porin
VAPPFNNDEFRLTNLFWRQGLAGERFVIQVGFLDVTDYLDVYGMSSPWLHFANLAFSTGSAAIPLPGDATLGMTAGAWLSENLYLHAGIADLNADPTEPWDGFENFFGDREYFTHVELGWTSGRGNQYLDNVHLTFWHVDERDETLTDDGWGFNFSAAWWLADAWLPFLRAGYTDDGGSLLSKSVSVGIGYQPPSGRDVLGLAFNWGKPNSNSFGPGRHDQYAIELFYRIQLLQHLAITPSFQWIGEPALNARDDAVWLFGLRVRLAL